MDQLILTYIHNRSLHFEDIPRFVDIVDGQHKSVDVVVYNLHENLLIGRQLSSLSKQCKCLELGNKKSIRL